MADPFFSDNESEQEEVEKIKVGEKEYTPDELNRLVGLGEIGVELEDKYNTKLDRVYPEYTKATQEVKTLREAMNKIDSLKPKEEVTLTDEEAVAKQVKDSLNKYGYIPAQEVEERARRIASEVVSGYRLLDQVNDVVAKQESEGNPKTSPEDLLAFMQENNLSNPEIAYKVRFEKELDAIKEKKLSTLKPQGLVTESQSTAGSKTPPTVRITRSNLGDVLDDYLRPRNA